MAGSVHTDWHGRPVTRTGLVSRPRTPRPILACVALALAVAAGCSNNPYPRGETAGSTLYFTLPDDPKTLDPSISYDFFEFSIITLIYPSYFRYHYLKRDPVVLELNLGAEPPRRAPFRYTVREHGRRLEKLGEAWTFRIRRGLRFQDDPCFPGGKGREITAADFLYTFHRMGDPAVPFPLLGMIEDKIIGFAEYANDNRARVKRGLKADLQRAVPGLQPVPGDRYAFRIILNQPYPQLRYLMAMPFTAPLAHEAVTRYGKDLARHPVGSGPYVLAEHTPKLRLVLRANPNRPRSRYPAEGMPGDREAGLLRDAGAPLPLANTIVWTIQKESITGWNQFLQGYQDRWAVTQENFQHVLRSRGTLSDAMRRKGVRLQRTPSLWIWYLVFNMKDPVVGGYTESKRKLRQAISLAFDAQAFIDLQAQGFGIPAQFALPPGLAGYDPAYRNDYRRFSISEAKRLLAEAGYPGGVDPKTGERLTIYYDNAAQDAAGRQQVGLLAKELEAIGVHMEARSWPLPVLMERLDTRHYQLGFLGWTADYPDPENYLMLLYGPNSTNRGPNTSCYDRPEVNRLFEEMRAMDDGPARMAIIRRMRALIAEDCPWVFLFHSEELPLTHVWLSNSKPHPIACDTAQYQRVDGALRARLQAEWNRPRYWPAVVGAALLLGGSLPAAGVVRRRRHRRARRARGVR